MASLTGAMIALSLGFLAYLLPALGARELPIKSRTRIGRYYYRMWIKAMGTTAIVRKSLGGLEIKNFEHDTETGTGKLTYSSGIVSGSKELHFTDEDNRLKRLFSKPLVLLHQEIPAVLDAELADLGYWFERHREDGKHVEKKDNGVSVNPYFQVPTGVRVVELGDARSLVANGSRPGVVRTTKEYTKKRFEKYGERIGLAETAGFLSGVFFGALLVAGGQYVRENLLGDGGGGGGGFLDGAANETVPLAIDMVVMVG